MKAGRKKESRRISVGSGYVHYYDIATGILDIRPIGKVYGIPNFYQDIRNSENINDLEEKLANLEGQASHIIVKLHKELPCGIFTLKRGPLDLLRKFLFVMHYRNTLCSSAYFQVDHPENARARQWIECFMRAHGIQSAVETWLHFLRYYLDTSHSDIMRDGMALVEKYGVKGLRKMLTNSHIPPDLENYPAFTYLCQAGGYFLSIWEAAEGEEFILTHNAFGLWEGLAGGCPGLHRIFVISPRVALVLRSGLLRPESKCPINQSLFHSSLLGVKLAPATPMYVSGVGSFPINSVESAMAYCHSKSSPEAADDSFVFQITKLSRHQTLELNSVVLASVKKTGSLTFMSRESMLRTALAFRTSRIHLPESDLLGPLIEDLTTTTGCSETLCPPLQSQAAGPDEDIDALVLRCDALCASQCNLGDAAGHPSTHSNGDVHVTY